MNLKPDPTELSARARADLRMGVPIMLLDRDGNGLLAAAVETLDVDKLAALRALEKPLILAITTRRAKTLKARAYDGDVARVIFPGDADLRWAHGLADPSHDLDRPLKGPLQTEREGSAELHRSAISLCKDARLLPAALTAAISDAAAFATQHNLTLLSAQSLPRTPPFAMHDVVSARLPLSVSEAGRLHVFRPEDGGEEHYAVEIGRPDRSKPVLTRLHSACFTGDLLGSLKCDCGPQLRGALAQMGKEGQGVLLYLNQEGRGIGLANKMRAYALQDQGFDTVEANHRLGFEDDERDFRIGADILKKLGFGAVRLLTNNPAKIERMESCGINVTERVSLKVGHTPQNESYLATKANKSGHLL